MENQELNQLIELKNKLAKLVDWAEESAKEAKKEGIYPRIASVNEFIANLEKAVSLMDQGIEKIKIGGQRSGVSEVFESFLLILETMLAMGKHLVEDGSWQRGLQLFRVARNFFSKFGNWQGQARASVEIGDTHLLMGDYEVAKMSYLDAQRYLRKIADEAGLAVVQQKLGALALFMYQADEAETQLKKAIAFFESHNDQKRAEVSRQLLQLAPEVRQTIPA